MNLYGARPRSGLLAPLGLVMTCTLCETRRPRRMCPGVRGEICALCCGTEREVTVHCPLDCEYLIAARAHERLPDLDPKDMPNRDIEVSEDFILRNEILLGVAMEGLSEICTQIGGAVDADVREALAAMAKTYRTRESGLIYETRPSNLVAAAIQQGLQARLDEFRRGVAERAGVTTVRDADVLGVLVFLQRLEMSRSNGRRLGRAFLHLLRDQAPQPRGAVWSPGGNAPLVVPSA